TGLGAVGEDSPLSDRGERNDYGLPGYICRASAPKRLFGPAAVMSTGATFPMNSLPAVTCTGCRYGERPTIWPGCRPGFSKSTSNVRPTHCALNVACCRARTA